MRAVTERQSMVATHGKVGALDIAAGELDLGRLRRRRSARPPERAQRRKGQAGHRRGQGGQDASASRCRSIIPAATCSIRAGIRRSSAARRGDKPNWHFRTEWDKPGMTDVINDDVVIMHLQYSTQWDTLAHVGALFDADGDGKPEAVFYNGYRGGVDMVGPERRQGCRRACQAHSSKPKAHLGQCARRREHGGQMPAGPRRDDRSRSRTTAASGKRSATTI